MENGKLSRDEMHAEIRTITARIIEVQRARKLTDRQLVTEYPEIGSTKTWRDRLIGDRLHELNAERALSKLRRVATVLDGGSPDEIFFADLPFAKQLGARLGLLEAQTNDRRILVCLAPNGTGKSAFARWAVAQRRAERAVVRCLPSWRNKIIHICNGIATALGHEANTNNVAEAEQIVLGLLRGTRRTLFIDQAHEGGVAVMHLLRAFVDETPSRFVYLAYETTYNQVLRANTDALNEAQAFRGRCLKPIFDIYKHGVSAADAAFYLQRVAGLSLSAAQGVANKIVSTLQRHTNLRLLDDAIASAAAEAEDGDPDPAVIVTEVYRLSGEQPAVLAKEAA